MGGKGCLSWVRTVIYKLPQSLQWCMQYQVVEDSALMALSYIYKVQDGDVFQGNVSTSHKASYHKILPSLQGAQMLCLDFYNHSEFSLNRNILVKEIAFTLLLVKHALILRWDGTVPRKPAFTKLTYQWFVAWLWLLQCISKGVSPSDHNLSPSHRYDSNAS